METRLREILRSVAGFALAAMLCATAGAQSNQSGGEQINPNTSLNSIISGGASGIAAPVDEVLVPVTPASDLAAPASSEKDRPSKRPLPVAKPPKRKKLSDRALARKIRREIRDDLDLPAISREVSVAAAAGKVTLTGTALNEDDKYKIEAKAAVLVGAENVVNLIAVKPGPAPQ